MASSPSPWSEGGARFAPMQEEHRRVLQQLCGLYGSRILITQLMQMDRTRVRSSGISTSSFSSTHSLTSHPFGGHHSDASTYQSDAASINDSIYSQSSFPDSATDPSIYLGSETASLNGHDLPDAGVPFSPVPPPVLDIPPTEPAQSLVAMTGKPINCPLCAIYKIYVGFTRKSDFKKHLQMFHNTNFLWICRHDKCGMVFDFERAYTNHVKDEHGEPQYAAADRAKVQLCPQVVFACGFVNCKDKVFEADSDEEAPAAANNYFEHVASHFDKKAQASGADAPSWEYRVQMQNLLRQRSLKELWKTSMWSKEARNALSWQPRSSCDLKKVLECRHLGTISELLHRTWTLGSTTYQLPNQSPPNFNWEATRPIRLRCPMAPTGHNQFSISHQKKPQPHAIMRCASSLSNKSNRNSAHLISSPVTPDDQSMNWDMSVGDIVGGPHPGTLMPIPEDSSAVGWQDPDPFDIFPGANTPDNAAASVDHHMAGAPPTPSHQHPHSSWPNLAAALATPIPPTPPDEMLVSATTTTSSSRPKTPIKRRISLGRKSFENLRKKGRNSSPHTERNTPEAPAPTSVPPMPAGFPPPLSIPVSAAMDFALPLRSHTDLSLVKLEQTPTPTFFFADHNGR